MSHRPSTSQRTRHIPLIRADLPALEAISEPLREVLESGRVTNFGKYVHDFEGEMSRRLGASTLTVSSGTTGLVLGLQALGVKPGDKVALPSFTFVATAQAVLYTGATPVFVDIDPDFTISTEDLAHVLHADRTIRCVIGVHTFGLPCHVEELDSLIRDAATRASRPLHLVYDAAHAFGARHNRLPVGGFGDLEVFSLSVTKALVSIEGGVVASRDEEVIARVRKMRNYGIEENYDAHFPGLNGKMSELHAIVGLYNLRRLDDLLEERQKKAKYYSELIRARTSFEFLEIPRNVIHTFKDFTLLLPVNMTDQRNAIMEFLEERGVETRAYFSPPVHRQRFFQRFADRPLPRTDELSRRVMTMPFFTTISEEEMSYVVEALADAEAHFQ